MPVCFQETRLHRSVAPPSMDDITAPLHLLSVISHLVSQLSRERAEPARPGCHRMPSCLTFPHRGRIACPTIVTQPCLPHTCAPLCSLTQYHCSAVTHTHAHVHTALCPPTQDRSYTHKFTTRLSMLRISQSPQLLVISELGHYEKNDRI